MFTNKVVGVVGSGLSSYACISRLVLDPSIKIVVLDNDKESVNFIDSIQKKIKEQANYINRLKIFYDFINKKKINRSHQINKSYFGSSIFNEEINGENNFKLYSSNSYGGFSNIWGAVNNTPLKESLDSWPIKYSDLSQYFYKIAKILNVCSEKDNMSSLLKFDYENEYGFNLSPIANEWYRKIKNRISEINKDDIFVGRSQLSLNNDFNKNKFCVECGMCMHGCPHDIIFNSRLKFDDLKRKNQIHYYRNYKVIEFLENKDKIKVLCKNSTNNNLKNFSFDYVFLAAGCLNSTKIIVNSIKELNNQDIIIKQNDNYIVPFFLKNIRSLPLTFEKNTLSQLSLVIRDKKIEEHGVYFQTYEFSDIVLFNLFRRLPYNNFFHKIIKNLPLLNKILFAQFWFDSQDSDNLLMRCSNGLFSLNIEKDKNITTNILKKIIAKLNKNNNLEVRFLSFLGKKFQAGGSYHLGSSFQMKKNNDLFSTDIFGRPYNFKKISVVDSSILPSLPSNSHTFLTMANCYRITDNLINKNFFS